MAESTGGSKPARSKSEKKQRTTKQKVLAGVKWATIGLLSLALIGIIGIAVLYATTEIPNPKDDFQTNTTTIYYRDGTTELGTLAIQNRQSIPYSEMPETIKQAVISAENREFWTDPGISPAGIVRAAWSIVTGGEMVGGSTITQQYIKIMYLTSERTFNRKLNELILAVKLNNERSKEQILEGYLNTIYFGRGAYGIEAAAKAYFNIPASKLTYQQAAVLASVLNAPAYFDPQGGADNVHRLTERYNYVLDGLVEMGKMPASERDQIKSKLPTFPKIPTDSRYGGTKGFLIRMVQDELLAAGMSEAQIAGGGLKIVTTFDKKSQDAIVATAQKYTNLAAKNANKPAAGLHAAMASVETSTGEVLAIYGGPDYVKNSRNWARTNRPTASTFKAFALIAGLRGGFTLNDTFKGNTFTPRGDGVPVRNAGGTQYGPVTLRRAVTDSINTAFVDMTQQLPNGPQEVIKAANDAGVPSGAGWDPNNRIALGTAESSPLRMASAFATFANDGQYIAPHVVKEVKDTSGNAVWQARPERKQTIEQDHARTANAAMETVVEDGTGSSIDTGGYTAAGKTGTGAVKGKTVSSWLVAYTKQISTAVMFVAGDDGAGDLDAYRRPGDAWFYSSRYPVQAWSEYMKVAMEGRPDEKFPDAPGANREPRTSAPQTTSTPTPTQTPTETPSETPTQTPTTVAPTPPAPTSQQPTLPPSSHTTEATPPQSSTTTTAPSRAPSSPR